MTDSAFDLFARGGSVMVPLALTALVLGYLIVERVLFYRAEGALAGETIHLALEEYYRGKEEPLLRFCVGPSCIARRVLRRIAGAGRKDAPSVERILDEARREELPTLHGKLPVIAVLAAVAPLLGLLGTVSGMIITFDVIAIHGTGDPHALSAGIGQALISTQAGLVVALPGFLMHSRLQARADRLGQEFRRISTYIRRMARACQGGEHGARR